MEDSVFERMAGLVRVRDIQTPFGFVLSGSADVKYPEKPHPSFISHRAIRDDLQASGLLGLPYLTFDRDFRVYLSDLNRQDGEDEIYAEPKFVLREEHLVSADTSLWHALQLFAIPPDPHAAETACSQRDALIVLDGNRFTGLLTPHNFGSQPARLCLLALTLELERAALEFCSFHAMEFFELLPEGRREKARRMFKERYLDRKVTLPLIVPEVPAFLEVSAQSSHRVREVVGALRLDCTNFIDKGTMLHRSGATWFEPGDIKTLFKRAERLRNACAHAREADDALPLTVQELVTLVHDSRECIQALKMLSRKARELGPGEE